MEPQPVLGTARPRGSKRPSESSSPGYEMNPKRTRGGLLLEDFSLDRQFVLRAAAEILNVPLDRLLVLANPSTTTSGTSSDRAEISSNSSSNGYTGDYTPPGSMESERTLDAFNVGPSGSPSAGFSDQTERAGTSNIPFRGQNTTFNFPRYRDNRPLEFDLTGLGGGGVSMDPFTTALPTRPDIYPTPPDSQYSHDQMSNALETSLSPNMGAWPLGLPWDTHDLQREYSQGNHHAMQESTLDHRSLVSSEIVDIDNFFGMDNQIPGFDTSAVSKVIDAGVLDFPPAQNPTEARIERRTSEKSTGAKGKRRGPFQRADQREETGLTRKLGACIRCSMQRIRCVPCPESPSGCCKTCIQAAQTRTLWFPCLRYKITDSELLDSAKCPRPTWTTRWKKMEIVDITNWASDEIKTIDVTQEVRGTSYTLKVREFVPVQGDALSRRWVYDGVSYEYKCTPYAVADMKEAGKVLSDFCENTLSTAIPFWIKHDPLLRKTYSMAYQYSMAAEREEDRALLKLTLRLWGASRMMSRAANICGKETLGMERRDFGPTSPSTNRILMPPVFSAQMEIIFVALIMEPTKKEILNRLKALVQDNSRRSWLAIYLCIFMLLHSCALLTARDNERGKLQGVNRRFYRPNVIDELHNGAKILLAYFHYCNRGSYPLHMDWTSEDQVALAELKPEQIGFLRETVKEFEKKAPHFRHILETNDYEDEYYFIAQLYERDWKPRHTQT